MIPFQFDRPVFIKQEFSGGGRDWKRSEHYPWKELSLSSDVVQTLYNNNFLYHNSNLEVKAKVGDGLEVLDVASLAVLVDTINAKVKAKTNSHAEFTRKKCKKSKILEKQRGLLRSWRRNYGELEND
tara:strand:- start:217 stop:597 length:381 start_codon:yes stop_codon:yes gene_type:complete